MKNLFCYFSATGNTARVVDILKSELKKNGQGVEELRLFAGAKVPSDFASYGRIIVAFPVLAMMTPVMVRRFLSRLPVGRRSDGTAVQAAVFAVAGGEGGPAAVRAGAILMRKGYALVMSARLNYPENWSQVGAVPKDAKDAAEKLAAGDETARALAAKLVAGIRQLDRTSIRLAVLGRILSALFGLYGRRMLGKLFIADERCTSCGLYARSCPASAIVLGKGKGQKPYWRMSCENCNRCINTCPKNAITSSILSAVLQIGSIGLLLTLGIVFMNRSLWPIVAPNVPGPLGGVLYAVVVVAVVLAAHVIPIGPLDYLVFRWLRRMPGLSSVFARGFAGGARRYSAPGFIPEQRGK